MTCFVLRTDDGDDIGFLGFAKHEGDWPPVGRIDCVFMPFGTACDHPCARFVRDHARREFAAEVTYAADTMRVDIPLGSGSGFSLQSSDDGNVWEITGADYHLSGTGRFL